MIEKPKGKKNKGAKLWNSFRRKWIADHPADYRGYWTCSACGKDIDKYYLHLDHIKTRGSAPELKYDPENIAPCCADCHLKRHGIL